MLRNYQKDCYEKLCESRDRGDGKCLVLMFCGTGKTRVFYKFMLDSIFSIAVFPTLALADQFMADYVKDYVKDSSKFRHLRISSDAEDKKTTTDPEKITRFLKTVGKKIIAVTYASLDLLFDVMKTIGCRADTIVYDEAHHVIGDKCQTLVFDKDVPVNFQAFFTATYRNANGIVMYNETGVSDCGPCIFRYTLPQAIDDGVCQDFEFCVFLSHCKDVDEETDTDKVSRNLRMIANAIVSNDCRRVIINHAFSEAENDTRTSISSFATKDNEKVLKSAIKKLDVSGKYKKVVYNGVGSRHKRRAEIIKAFNTDTEDEVHIISQCKIFSEGIDTRQADMTVFIDEKASCHVIIQIIGRVTRKKSTDKKGIILIPIVVDIDLINEAKTREERDEILRSCINEERNFNPILNVMTALREEDPEYYEMCLRYPFSFSPLEIEKRINESGRVLEMSRGTLKENIEYLVGEDVEIEEDEEDLERVASVIKKPIRVITQNMEDGKTFENYGREYDGDVVEMFRNEEGEYQPIKNNGKSGERGVRKDIEHPKRKPFANKIKFQSDIKIVWDISEMKKTLTDEIIVSLESKITDNAEKWEENLEWCKKFILLNNNVPSQNAEELYYNKWLNRQTLNYKKSDRCMGQDLYRKKWEEFKSNPIINIFIEDRYFGRFLEKLNEYYSLFLECNKNHSECWSKDKKISGWRRKQLEAYNAYKGSSLSRHTEERKKRILELMPDFFELSPDSMQKCQDYYNFYCENGSRHAHRPKKDSKKVVDPKERDENYMYRWRNCIRVAWKKMKGQNTIDDSEEYDKSYWEYITLTADMIEFLTDKMPDFFENLETTDEDRMMRINNYEKFFNLNKRQPVRCFKKVKNNEELLEHQLAEWRGGMKSAFKGHAFFKGVLTSKMSEKLLTIDPNFFKEDVKTDSDREQDIKNYIDWRKTNPHPKTTIQKTKNENCTPEQLIQKKWSLWAYGINKGIYIYSKILTDGLCKMFPEVFKKENFKKPHINCLFILKTGKRKNEKCDRPCVQNELWCSRHKKSSPKTKDFLSIEEETEIILLFTCSKCSLDFPLELEVNFLCPSCRSSPLPQSPIPPIPSSHPPPPIKTLEECKDKASALSQDQLIEKVAKKTFQEQKGYRPSMKKADPDKQRANLLFVERSSQKIGLALILDSQNFLTTNALIDAGYDREYISIPQYDKTEYLIQKKTHNNVSNQSLNAFLQDTKIEKFSTAWFDYTCTYSGNVGCRPKDDIELYFSRKFADNESTFAVTFSKREKTDEEELRVDETRKHISLLAKKNGYALTDEVKFEYGNMYFIMWEVLERRV